MLELVVFISCGAEVAALRDVARRVLDTLERVFLYGLDISITIRNWDYRDEPPEVVSPGQFSARSLQWVDKSSAVIGILGPTVPDVTAQELIRAIARYATGQADNVWLFVASATRGDVHKEFLARVEREAQMTVVFQEFDGELDLQAKIFRALIPYVVKKAILDRRSPVPNGSIGDLA